MLTDNHKKNHAKVSQQLSVNADGHGNFHKNIITGNEM